MPDPTVPAALLEEITRVVTATRQLLGAAACSCALVDDAGERLRFVAADGAGADAIVGVALPADRGIAGWVAMTGEPIAVGAVQDDARFARDVAESTDYVPETILAAPLLARDGTLHGVLEVLDPAGGGAETVVGEQRGTAAALSLLTIVAVQLATAVEWGRATTADRGAGARLVGDVLAAVEAYHRDGP